MSECDCILQKRVVSRLPRLYRKSSLIDFGDRIQICVMDWLGKPGDGLFISGKAGVGKTYLAAAIVRSLTLIRAECRFVRSFDFYSDLRASYRQQETEAEAIRSYTSHPYVALD